MAITNFANLTNEQKTAWSMDVWKAARNNMFLNKFLGDGPTAMIQRITELKKTEKGTRAVITLVPDLVGDGIAGDRQLEGNEEDIVSHEQVIQIDQLRHANRHEGKMAEQKSVVTFRKESKDVLSYWLADRYDQQAFLTLSGIVNYAQTTNGAPRVGSAFSQLEYAADVTAPSTNRLLTWSKGGTDFTTHASNANLLATDTPSWAMLVLAKAYAKNNFIRPMRGEDGEELYHVFMTPSGFAHLKLDTDFLAAWRNAMPRSKDNPLFKGMTSGIMVDGLVLHEYRHVYNTTGAAGGSKWGGGAVDGQRILFCGAQAMGFADIGSANWVEKEFDYDNQPGISVGKICGFKKPVFRSPVTQTDEDFGLMCIDTAI